MAIKQDEDHDIVWTLEAIGKVINRDKRAVEYLIDRYADFPVKKVAGGYVASRKALLAYLLEKEAA
ncbi:MULTISPECIES: hypothetical protein [unclassified Mesorhizobium]|uniref:hypothetical protein n=1 Tax=unclassified Mesorhizobium TaxID=325217 RepID=UPI000FD7574D|nr:MULTISPECIES: hypothetical protein [unclassified Mesorhizobium]TGQ08711.1 hypothetical protein EN862_020900 [Mesorhizobium sp. M2E.F.Ca.ET.219.01.1.1]TGT69246.1 hypothetical protein EN809_023180 [Mesorhizobium sp. M2E.F.Ca.ET.166.01.1.1]TGW01578.1 hypothetical protein EN797_014675 [Mesorhizobium sp. M2E.F.Ca.ET.154.01.1.1]